MRVYKFGGASVKDAESIKNVAKVIEETQFKKGLIVISAMGKTTNALEELVVAYRNQKDFETLFETLKKQHLAICEQLFSKNDTIFQKLDNQFDEITEFVKHNKSTNYNFIYDQIVSQGEMLSTIIVSEYFNSIGLKNQWIDAKNYIKTDSNYREGMVDWKQTESAIQALHSEEIYITQGFIASDANNFSVTLGREGSDYTASIFSYCLNAQSMTIWKDVQGVLNADPRYFSETTLLHKISYTEAVELAFYGASVIHPKTLKPLENKDIPFFVKSFENPTNTGTEISKGVAIEPHIPCFILKQNQILVEISPKDFSFISENHISEVFQLLSESKLKTSLMQISAISLSLCIEDKFERMDEFEEKINQNFKSATTKNVSLFTVRHFEEESKKQIMKDKKVLLEQTVKETLQIVVQNA